MSLSIYTNSDFDSRPLCFTDFVIVRFIWAICGSGFCLDVMWIASLAYAAPNIQQEFGYSDREYGNLFSCFYTGLMVGAVVWGGLVDVIGRQ